MHIITKVGGVLRRARPPAGQIPLRSLSDWSRCTAPTRVCPQVFHLSESFSCHSLTDPDGDEINVDGTLKWCQDLGVDPEDVVLLPIAYELKSPSVGSFPRKPWIDGWKSLNCDSISLMQSALPKLRDKLANDPAYFTSVYNYTFEFAKSGAQRSIGVDIAIAFWGLLIPHGLTGAALAHTSSVEDDDDDDDDDASMDTEEGWKPEFTDWWFEFLTAKGGKGVSKDTWTMVNSTFSPVFSPLITGYTIVFAVSRLRPDHRLPVPRSRLRGSARPLQFPTCFVTERFVPIAAWPSSIDDFVTYVKEEKLESASQPPPES